MIRRLLMIPILAALALAIAGASPASAGLLTRGAASAIALGFVSEPPPVCAYTIATGGTETTDGDYRVHTFTSSGSLDVSCVGTLDPNMDYLIVAGGGGGGGSYAGGGGAGGRIYETAQSLSVGAYPIVVGAGGTATTEDGANGSNSTFNGETAIGGGGVDRSATGLNGGSGGGGSGDSGAHGLGTAGQGNDGGTSAPGVGRGGGGGAGATGGNGSGSTGGNGGAGAADSITGSSVTRAGGGGAGGSTFSGFTAGTGGSGGGGAGSAASAGTAGTANTGGGGGGGGFDGTFRAGGNGGSGVVIVRIRFQ